ncbi:MAG: nucleotidyl transferase AbiEii/AbiGii toxin family protein [Desulfuromonadales bacterium]
MSLFELLVSQVMREKTALNSVAMVVEKELLQHDILREMSGSGLLEKLTFMGGTCLRTCYGSNRLSEDLDFTGGSNFSRESLEPLQALLIEKLRAKYGLDVEVSEPKRETGNVDTWKMKMVTRPEQKGTPVQRINIDICAVPSYDRRPMMLRNHYGVDMGTSGLILQAESREEILADKLVALALRPGRIKNRDLWDIVWLKQQGILLPMALLEKKIIDHHQTVDGFVTVLASRREFLVVDDGVRIAFEQEMKRFLPLNIVRETLDNKDFWVYVANLITAECNQVAGLLSGSVVKPLFNM